MRDAVKGYLDELATALRVSVWRRRRIVAEIADHLGELVGDELDRGADPASAVGRAAERFGAPADLADEFNADAARDGLNRASRAGGLHRDGGRCGWSLAASGCDFPALARRSGLLPGDAAVGPDTGGLRGDCAVLGRRRAVGARATADRSPGTPCRAQLGAGERSVAAGGRGGRGQPRHRDASRRAAAVGDGRGRHADCGDLGFARCLRASWLADQWTTRTSSTSSPRSAARWPGEQHSPTALRSRWTGMACRSARAPRATRWLDLRHHPWRAAATTSVAAGLALTAPDLLIGDPDFLATAVEAVAVFGCFAALGGVLGLRAERPRDRAEIAATG